MLRLRRGFLTVLATAALVAALPVALCGQTPETLKASYDDNDQLIKVVDPSGNVTAYTYDAIGNMLSITQSTLSSANGLTILNFTPQQGGIGTTVTIQGQSFSATPSANTVKFNGTEATVTTATTTSLTVAVPAGATTGPISVTVGSSTTTAASNFTIVQNPVITSINPASALQGATVSSFQVTGVNLTGAAFSFVPAFVPAAIAPSNVSISPDGTSASMTLNLTSNAVGSFGLVATTGAGSSSQISGPNNTLTVLSTNPSADADGDGLTNLYEVAITSNPQKASTTGDGIPDGWALFFGLSPLNAGGASQTAPDGLSYLQAYQQGLNPLIPTLVPPTVSNVFPANGTTSYPTNGVIVVRFSEPLQTPATLTAAQNAINAMLPAGSSFSSANATFAAQVLQAYLLRTCCGGTAAVPGTIQLFQGTLPIGGTVALSNDGLSLVFSPTQPLSSSTTYTVVAQGVKGASGVQMTQVFQSTFTTGLTSTSATGNATLTSPANGATNVPTNAAFMVQFSQQVDPATLTPQTFYLYDTVSGQTWPGMLQVDPSGFTASFVPQTPFNAGRLYYAYLTSGILDITQNSFSGATFSFTTGFGTQTQGPQLQGLSPQNNATLAPLNSLVVAQFNEPISVISATTGLQLLQSGTPIPGAIALSNGNTLLTFTPMAALLPSTVYTIAVTNTITDVAENALMNPGNFTFTTGATSDTTTPSVKLVDPPNGSFGVGLNVKPRLTFNEPINPLTIPTAITLQFPSVSGASLIIPVTVTVSTDNLTATLSPSAPLSPNSEYLLYLCGYTNVAGKQGSCFESTFYTGTSAVTSALTVRSISPANSQTAVPVNAQINVVMSNNIDPTTVSNNSITVTPSGGSAIAGTVTLASNGVNLTFAPAATLTASTSYTVSVSGISDIDGNAAATFTSTFTTSAGAYAPGSFTVASTSPLNGATNVPVTSPITFTMSNLINAASVNTQTVEVCFHACGSEYVAGSFQVSGNTVTFTPLTPYPGNTVMGMYVYGLTDEAGNAAYANAGTFTTASTADTTAPTVTISPANGTQNVGLNAQIVLTFSKSINPATITQNTLALFNGDTSLSYNYTISPDNRTVVLNYNGGTLPGGATITIELTSGIQDLSGNSLANTKSQFTLTPELSGSAPYVIQMRPGNGATNIPANSVVTLFTNTAMNPATVAAALHVTDNGAVISGSVQLFSNGQAIEFTPSAPFNPGDLIQVFLGPGALSADGVALSSFSGQFTIAGSPTKTAAVVQAVNPFPSETSVPLNAVIQIAYNQPLLASTINSTNVVLYQYSTSTFLTPTLSLSANGQVINIKPTSNLLAGSQYYVYVNYGGYVTSTGGVNVQTYELNFTAGTAADTAAPTIVSLAPTNLAANIGTNALVSVNFNKAINPISVTGSTIALTAGSTTEVPLSIAFNSNYTRVSITPQAPLPASTQIAIAVNGVTSQAGVAVASQTTHFTTAAGPSFIAPSVISSSVQSGQTNVPVNSVFSMTFSEPMDIGSYIPADVNVYGGPYSSGVPATVSWSSDQTTIFIVPTSPLNVGTEYCMESYYMTDLSGNPQQNSNICFTASFASNTTPPTVVNTSPENTETLVPVNAPVEILFSEPIQPTSIGQITLTTGGNPVAVTPSFSDANQLLTLTPNLPLLASNANYTITITGVEDTAGNRMAGTVTNTFTTGPTFNLLRPSVTVGDPPNGATGVGTNIIPRIVFSERLNPLSVVSSSNELYNRGSIELYNGVTSQYVPATVSLSADRQTATITPKSALQPDTLYYLYVGYGESYYDVAGNYGNAYQSSFVTGTSSIAVPVTVSSINPSNAQTGVPQNVQINAVLSNNIDPTTVTNSSITVTPSGGSAIAGTVTLASNGLGLTFVPTATLTPSTVYKVSIGGFTDIDGNAVTAFTSTFTTGSGAYAPGSFTLASTTPLNGATNVSVTSPITFTMSNLINAASVNTQSVEVCFHACGSEYVSGTYQVSGNTVTFTPLTPYPGNTVMGMYIYGLTDEAGNAAYANAGTFTTASTVDTKAPTVTISPANGTQNVGLNTQIVLTFSKSINPATITSSSVNLLKGDVPLNPATSVSPNNRTVVLNYNGSTLPAGATLTVIATSLITDLSGNALTNTTSQFTTTPPVSNSAPSVISVRPGNGATGVPASTVVTLFTSAPMNASTINSALHISQNGVIVSGTTAVGGNGQSIEFTPDSAFSAGATIQVFLDSTAQDIYGNYLSSYSGQFTIAGSPTNTAAVVEAVNPFPNETGVPLNAVLQIAYNQPLLASTINSTNVVLYQYSTGTFLTPTLSLSGNGQVINVTPTSNLIAGSQYYVYVNYGGYVTNTDGVKVQSYELNFTAGTATDTAAPTILSLAPTNSAANIGTNALVSVNFNKAINPISVTGSTITLTAGSTTEVPLSIAFTSNYTRVSITPQAPLPASTQIAIGINGVTSQAGVPVASQTTHFTTAAGPSFMAPSVVSSSVQNGQTVGTNAVFAMQFNEPIDPGSVNPGGITTDVYLYDYTSGYVATNITFSADLTTVFLAPKASLTAGHQLEMCSYYITDLTGNPQQNFCVSGFYVGTGVDTTGPAVQQVSPPNGFTGVGINAPVNILFNEPISASSVNGVTLEQGSTVIPVTTSLYDGDKGVQLLPLVPLAPGTVYAAHVTGVVDITGNAQSTFSPASFTTGTGAELVKPTIVSTSPTNGQTATPDNTSIQVVFSEAMDPAVFDPNNTFVLETASNTVVPAAITFSADYKTVTLQPSSNLTGGGVKYYMYIGYFAYLYDLGGNQLPGTYISFTTQ